MSAPLAVADSRTRTLLEWAERIIQQTHYETLDQLVPRSPDQDALRIRPADVTCLFRITELVFNRSEGSLERLAVVLNSLHACAASCVMLLECKNGRSELYMGAVNKQRYDNANYLNTLREILRSGLEGNLPGTELRELVSRAEIDSKLEQCINSGFDSQCITAISCVASEPDGSRTQGIEALLEAVGDQNFTIMVLADPVDRDSIKEIRYGYENLVSQLSSMSELSLSVQTGESTTASENYSESLTETVSRSLSLTQSHTSSTGWSHGTTRNEGDNSARAKLVKGGAVAAGLLSIGKAAASASAGPFFAMSAINTLFGSTVQNGQNDTVTGGENDTTGSQVTDGRNIAKGETLSRGLSKATSRGYTVQSASKDRHTIELINRVEWYLNWLNKCENYGMFNCCAYVISSSAGVNMLVASQYQALMQGKREMSQPVTINTWTAENGVEMIRSSLMRMSHPVMDCGELEEGFSPAMLVSSRELSRQLALPQRSVVGISVMEYAHFGREVVRKTPLNSGRVIRIGSVTHMGKTLKNQPVLLDLQSMAAHTFIAGTNGSGKSNTVFKLLEEMMEADIPFMVIEPAKGEYKNVFGREKNVSVYGTNKKKTQLLRLNPFWFNEDVDVLEHIDKLLQVFNASWSMYAAMPAVLKTAIESAYIACGWDLNTSECRGGCRIFPTVRDVLAQFNTKMETTAFSDEVKGNYVGALSTRMESLCNGIYGEIFGGRNLSDTELFDTNVIVDLSRVGSAETKAMIMGMLIIRLTEYRMSTPAMNLPLKHVTVLEEAHHLLRKTSFGQSDEGSNLMGKSVEMISTSIAEMRSYGEGFMIVDQSPGLLDTSVTRNTNTKIILRLPEAQDRDAVGHSMGLTAEQIHEISRMKTGVCAIYQKDWLEAVCCQVDKAAHEEELYAYTPVTDMSENNTVIIKALLDASSGLAHPNHDGLVSAVEEAGLSGMLKARLIREFSSGTPDQAARPELLNQVINKVPELPPELTADAVDKWYSAVINSGFYGENLGKEYAGQALIAQIGYLAREDDDWCEVLSLLPDGGEEIDRELPQARGTAFTKLCPLFCRSVDIEQRELEDACKRLNKSNERDRTLSSLLKKALSDGTVRRRMELEPYATLVWEYLGGQKLWDKIYPCIEAKAYDAFNDTVYQRLAKSILTDKDTTVSLISLFLQKRGADAKVKSFYNPWLRSALNRKWK